MALTTVFILIIGEDWNWTMYQWTRAYGWDSQVSYFTSIFFFVFLMIIGNIVLFSVFTAILLQNFDGPDDDEEEEEEADGGVATEADAAKLLDAAPQSMSQRLMSKDTWAELATNFKFAFGKKARKEKILKDEGGEADAIELAEQAPPKGPDGKGLLGVPEHVDAGSSASELSVHSHHSRRGPFEEGPETREERRRRRADAKKRALLERRRQMTLFHYVPEETEDVAR